MTREIGRYKIQERIGRGGMASVYRALDTRLNGREVAVKVLSEELAKNQALLTRFRNDAYAAARLRHPNIIDIYDFDAKGEHYYIVMPYIPTGTLQQLLDKRRMLSPEKAVELLVPIADALHQAHEKDLVHRDIKPANILIDEWGTPILTDFGIARVMRQFEQLTPSNTDMGTKIGTPFYMSPEQAAGKRAKKAADIYSLGVVLYQAVTGVVPFNGEDAKEIRGKHINESPRNPSEINRGISVALEAVILKALAKKPEERFQSADEMAQAMLEAVGQAISVGVFGLKDKESENNLSKLSTLPLKDEKVTPSTNSSLLEKIRTWITEHLLKTSPGSAEPSTDEPERLSEDTEEVDEESTLIQGSNILICHQTHTIEQRELIEHLYHYLASQGYQLLSEHSIRASRARNEKINRQLQQSHLLVVLFSEESANNKMMQKLIQDAYDYRKLQEFPRILPIRMGISKPLAASIEKYLDPRQYILWESPTDHQQVSQKILAVIQGELPLQPPLSRNRDHELEVEQKKEQKNNRTYDVEQILKQLSPPEGAYTGPLYVEREDDLKLLDQLDRKDEGTLTTIRAARQTGKTSLLVKGIRHAHQHGIKVVNLDLQRMDRSYLQSTAHFCRYLAEYIVWEQDLDLDEVEKVWRGPLGPQDKLTRLLGRYVLPKSNEAGILLAMDEVDRLLETDFSTDFFALVRAWHNSRAYSLDSPWRKLHLILVISTEPSLLIADDKQSPFNVGLRLYLEDFTRTQVESLNDLHGSPLKVLNIRQMMTLLNGHPYLTRKALYTLVTEKWPWSQLEDIALTNKSPFIEHLRRYDNLLRDKEDLKAGLREVMKHERCSDGLIRYRLLRAGLVKGDSEHCVFRCDLYRKYFRDKL